MESCSRRAPALARGFGASPAELDHWAGRSRQACVEWLIRGGPGPHGMAEMVGPEPTDQDGGQLDPGNEWGHDQVWWLDRMVRSQRPLVEKMTLFWHDHFATRARTRRSCWLRTARCACTPSGPSARCCAR